MPVKRRMSSKLAGRVKALESMVNKTMENKVVDYDNGSSPTAISTTGLTFLAFARNLQTGDEGDQRVGNKITLMSQTFRGLIRAPSGVTDEAQNQVRILIVENLGYTGLSDLSLEDVLQKGLFSVDGTQVFVSPYKTNAAESKRYRVHYDKVVTLNKTDKGYFHFKKRISYGTKNNRGKVLSFATSTSSFPNNHRLVMFVISDSSIANHPDITWNVRNIYKDA
jgi:hypothetical protein